MDKFIKSNATKLLEIFRNKSSKIFEKGESLLHSLGFSFKICWQASKWLLLVRVILEAFSALQPIVLVYISKEFIDLLVIVVRNDNPHQSMMRFISILTLALLTQVLGIIIQKINEISVGIHKDLIGNHIKVQLIKKTVSLDLSYFDSPKFHDELLNSQYDSQALETMAWFSVSLVRSGVQVAASTIILFNLHWIFPLVLIVLSIPASIIEQRFTHYTYNWMRSRTSEERKMQYFHHILTDRGFAKDVRLYSFFEEMFARYKFLWNKWFGQRKNITLRKGVWATLASILPELGAVGVVLYVGQNIISHKLTIGDFSLYYGIAFQIVGSLFMLITTLSQIYDNQLRITNYCNFLTWKPNFVLDGNLIPNPQPSIEFKDVSFRYPGADRFVLSNLNFKIATGEKIALVGLNGAGKSTIIKLLLCFYQPSAGEILLDGINIQKYDSEKMHKLFGVVFQDYANYAFTAREDIALSELSEINNETRLQEACSMSETDRLAAKWPKGLDTHLTKQFAEDGIELSGGEWQKIALARAFFSRAPIIVLDEPTASLDPEAEYRVLQHYLALCQGKSTIFISHRLSSVTLVDRILVLEGGKIIEEGSHEALMAKGGRYSYLFRLQAEKYIK